MPNSNEQLKDAYRVFLTDILSKIIQDNYSDEAKAAVENIPNETVDDSIPDGVIAGNNTNIANAFDELYALLDSDLDLPALRGTAVKFFSNEINRYFHISNLNYALESVNADKVISYLDESMLRWDIKNAEALQNQKAELLPFIKDAYIQYLAHEMGLTGEEGNAYDYPFERHASVVDLSGLTTLDDLRGYAQKNHNPKNFSPDQSYLFDEQVLSWYLDEGLYLRSPDLAKELENYEISQSYKRAEYAQSQPQPEVVEDEDDMEVREEEPEKSEETGEKRPEDMTEEELELEIEIAEAEARAREEELLMQAKQRELAARQINYLGSIPEVDEALESEANQDVEKNFTRDSEDSEAYYMSDQFTRFGRTVTLKELEEMEAKLEAEFEAENGIAPEPELEVIPEAEEAEELGQEVTARQEAAPLAGKDLHFGEEKKDLKLSYADTISEVDEALEDDTVKPEPVPEEPVDEEPKPEVVVDEARDPAGFVLSSLGEGEPNIFERTEVSDDFDAYAADNYQDGIDKAAPSEAVPEKAEEPAAVKEAPKKNVVVPRPVNPAEIAKKTEQVKVSAADFDVPQQPRRANSFSRPRSDFRIDEPENQVEPQAAPVGQPEPQAAPVDFAVQHAEAASQAAPQKVEINVSKYMEAIRELWEDLKGTMSFFSMDSNQFKDAMASLNDIFKDGKVDAERLDYACNVLAVDSQAYLAHADRHPRPGNTRREARVDIMKKMQKLTENYLQKKESDPKESYVETVMARMKEKIIVTTGMKIDTVETSFKNDDSFKKKIQSLSIYQLDKITNDEAQMEKMMRDFLAAGNRAKAKEMQIEKTVSKNQKTRW